MSRIKEAMFEQIDRQFGDAFGYPRTPGAKAGGTSAEAAAKVAPAVGGGRALVLESLRLGPKTADEVAAAMGRSVLYVRPRITELSALALIERTGDRRKNDSGLAADVWRAL